MRALDTAPLWQQGCRYRLKVPSVAWMWNPDSSYSMTDAQRCRPPREKCNATTGSEAWTLSARAVKGVYDMISGTVGNFGGWSDETTVGIGLSP